MQGINDLAAPFICTFLYNHLNLEHQYAINDGYVIRSAEDLPTPREISKVFKIYDPSVHGSESRDVAESADSRKSLYAGIPSEIAALLKNIEADTFWCLTNFLERIQDNYTPIQPGMVMLHVITNFVR